MYTLTQNLNALSTFVYVSRHLSFTKAALELNLTQGAVSIQIKQLEQALGFQLFRRETRKILLTAEGQELLEVVEPALMRIQTKIEAIQVQDEDEILTVSTLPSFAAKWLIPRIPIFQSRYPEINLRVHTCDHMVDFFKEKVDCAIRYGLGNYPGLSVHHLIDEVFVPVCSPDLITAAHPLQDPDDIQYYQLLHDDYGIKDYNTTWKEWADANGIRQLDVERGLQFGQADFVIQAAIARQGIALARETLIGDDVKAGLLLPLFGSKVRTKYASYFVTPFEFEKKEKVAIFRDWVMENLKRETAELGKLLKKRHS
ncbi:MAG: transcriptional regulator GcvA [SAR324 cluster bacterium]|nr:transcriptional regulator GcvA [SAR324 cluster bacterium]